MLRKLRKNYRRLVAFMLTVAMTFTNVGTNLNVAFAAGEEQEALFLVDGTDLREAIDSAVDGGETFKFSSLELKAKSKSLKNSYEKLIGGKNGKVYQLDVDVDERYAPEDTSVEVFYNEGTDEVIFLFINESDMVVKFRANVDGYETARVTINPNAANVDDTEASYVEDYSNTNMIDDMSHTLGAEVLNPTTEAGADEGTDAEAEETTEAVEGPAGETSAADGSEAEESSEAEETSEAGETTEAGEDVEGETTDAAETEDSEAGETTEAAGNEAGETSEAADGGEETTAADENSTTEETEETTVEETEAEESEPETEAKTEAEAEDNSDAEDAATEEAGAADEAQPEAGSATASISIRKLQQVASGVQVEADIVIDPEDVAEEETPEISEDSQVEVETEEETEAAEETTEEETEEETEETRAAETEETAGEETTEAGEETSAADPEETTVADTEDGETDAADESSAVGDETDESGDADIIIEETTAADGTDGTDVTDTPVEVETPAETTPADGNNVGGTQAPGDNSGAADIPDFNEGQELEDDINGTFETLGTLNGKAYNTVTIWDSANARAYKVAAKDLAGIEAVAGEYRVDYSVDPVGTATVKGSKNIGEGENLYFAVKPQVGFNITTVTANGVELEAMDAEIVVAEAESLSGQGTVYVVEEVAEDLEIVASLEEAEGMTHPEFNASYKASDGVTITLHAEEGILPEGTELDVTEVTAELEDAVKEKVEGEAEDGDKKVTAVLAYDINLILNGEKLDNSWSNQGYVDVTFAGPKIEELTEAADTVTVYAADDTNKAQLTAERASGVTAEKLELETVSEEDVTDTVSDEVSFEAKHFTIYVVTADKKDDVTNKNREMQVGDTATIQLDTTGMSNVRNISWSSSKTTVATVNTKGTSTTSATVEAVGAGETTITCSYTYGKSQFFGSWVGGTKTQETYTITVSDNGDYTITFNLNGGSGTAPEAITIPESNPNKDIVLPGQGSMYRENYTFMGWGTKPNSGTWDANDLGRLTIYLEGDVWTATSDVTLYAVWATKQTAYYFIRLDGTIPQEPGDYKDTTGAIYTARANGSDPEDGSKMKGTVLQNIFHYSSAGVDSRLGVQPSTEAIWKAVEERLASGKTISFKNGEETYKHCDTAEDFNNKYEVLWYVIKENINVDGVLLLKNQPKVSYEVGVQTGLFTGTAPKGSQYTPGTTVKIEKCDLARPGYSFGGWKDESTGATYANSGTASFIMPDTDVVLKAIWTPITSSISGTKTWIDGGKTHDNKTQVTLTLSRQISDGQEEPVSATPDWDGNTYTFRNLSQYDENGNPYIYKVTEQSIDGYEVSYDGYNIINKIADPKNITVTGTKTWVDGGLSHVNADEVTLTLKRQSKKPDSQPETMPNRPIWDEAAGRYTFSGLDKYDSDGYLYEYTVEETNVREGYTSSTDASGLNFTNTINTIDQTTPVSGTKTWVDVDDEHTHTHPTLTLSRRRAKAPEGTAYTVVSAVPQWETDPETGIMTYTYSNLRKYDNEGYLYEYKVEETAVDGYTTTYDKDNAYNITNEMRTKDATYTVEYYKDGNIVAGDTITQPGKVWVNDNPGKITVPEEGISAANDRYVGYKLEKTEPETLPNAGDRVEAGTTIKIYYIQDKTKTKLLKTTVGYNVDGKSIPEDSGILAKGTVWILDPDTLSTDGFAPKTYPGYKLDHIMVYATEDDKVGTDVGKVLPDTLTSGNHVVYYYVKDVDQTQPTNYTVEYYRDGEKVEADSYSRTSTAWINEENPEIAVQEAIDVSNDKYVGYRLDSTAPNPVPDKGTMISTGVTIRIDYVRDDGQIKLTNYKVEYYKDAEIVEADSYTRTSTAWINDETPEIAIQEAIDVSNDKYVGYKLESTTPNSVPEKGAMVSSGAVIQIKYVRDDDQTQPTNYKVEYFKDGVKVDADSYTRVGTAWINETAPIIAIQDEIDVADNKYVGFKLGNTDPVSVPQKGDNVANGTTIRIYYIKDSSQTQPTSYKVEYYRDGVKVEADSYVCTSTAWINDSAPVIRIQGEIDASNNKYVGYKLGSTDPNPIPAKGDDVPSETVIRIDYVKDDSQTQPTNYIVEYYRDNVKVDVDSYIRSSTAWINDNPAKIAIQEDIDVRNKKYVGYKLKDTDPSSIPAKGTEMISGSIIKIYYEKDSDDTKNLRATVDYNVGGSIREADHETLEDTVWVNDPDILSTENARVKTYVGYHLSGIEVNGTRVDSLAATVPANTAIVYYYDEDPDITITYVVAVEEGDTAHGGVTASAASTIPTSLENSETLAPVTATAKGSTAVPAEGYRFVQWTDATGRPVSDKAAFVPNKANGLNVAATYQAHFAKRGDLKYEVHYFYENPTAGANYVENEGLRKIVPDAVFESDIPYATDETKWNERTYVFEKIEGATKVSANADDNILNVYYALDELGETDPEDDTKKNPDRADGIPDKYQIEFTYKADENGEVTGMIREVRTIREVQTGANGLVVTDKILPAKPSQPSTVNANQGFYFLKWEDDTKRVMPEKVAEWPDDYQRDTVFTAFFNADPNNSWTASKEVIEVPARGYFRVGEQARFRITVQLTGEANRPIQNIRLEEMPGATFVASTNGSYTLENNGRVARIAELNSERRSVTLEAVYTVTRNDLFNRNFRNTVKITGEDDPDTMKEPGFEPVKPLDITSKEVPAGAQGGGGSSGGGGGGGSSTRSPGTGDGAAGGPGVPTTVIEPEAVPLANLPDMGNDDILALIDDEEVPLAALPKTGQTGSAALMLMISSMMLAAFAVVTRKKEDEQ